MILFEILQDESHAVYQELEISNGTRQYDFLRSLVGAALAVQRPFLSEHILKALNFHAITCLHTNAGEYRPCPVKVGDYNPPAHYQVDALMEDFVNQVNRNWEASDPVHLGAWVLWKLNQIHPFINGNGRSARAASYFVICVKVGQWLPGTTILPELLRQNRPEYVAALKQADQGDLAPLHALMTRLLEQQLNGPTPATEAGATAAPPQPLGDEPPVAQESDPPVT